jgi:hypothetical protein
MLALNFIVFAIYPARKETITSRSVCFSIQKLYNYNSVMSTTILHKNENYCESECNTNMEAKRELG